MPPLFFSVDTVYLTTTFAWLSLTTGGGACKIQSSTPRGRSCSQCSCVFFFGAVIVITTTSSSFSRAYACHVYIHVCIHLYLPKFNKQKHYYDPYRSYHGNYFTVILLFVLGKNMTQGGLEKYNPRGPGDAATRNAAVLLFLAQQS